MAKKKEIDTSIPSGESESQREIQSLRNDLIALEQKYGDVQAELGRLQQRYKEEVASRILTESSLRKTLLRFETLLEQMPGAIYWCANDAAWTMEFISQQIEQISGYPAREFIENSVRTYASVIVPEDIVPVINAVNRSVKSREPYVIKYHIQHRDGSYRWVHERGRGVYDTEGQLLWLTGVIVDITGQQAVF